MRSTPSRLISSSVRPSSDPFESSERTPPETARLVPIQQPSQAQQQYSPDGDTLVDQDSQSGQTDGDEDEPHSRFVEDLTPTSEIGPAGTSGSSGAVNGNDSDDSNERRPTGVRKTLLDKFKLRYRHSNGSSHQLNHVSRSLQPT